MQNRLFFCPFFATGLISFGVRKFSSFCIVTLTESLGSCWITVKAMAWLHVFVVCQNCLQAVLISNVSGHFCERSVKGKPCQHRGSLPCEDARWIRDGLMAATHEEPCVDPRNQDSPAMLGMCTNHVCSFFPLHFC